MGVIIKGTDDTVKAADGSLSIEGFSIKTSGIGTFDGGVQVGSAATIHSNGNLGLTGIITATNFKTGNSNVHNTGYNVGTGASIHSNGNAAFAGIVTTNGGLVVKDLINLPTSGDLAVGVSTFIVDYSAGRVGIKTEIPGNSLDVKGGGINFGDASQHAGSVAKLEYGGNTGILDIKATSTGGNTQIALYTASSGTTAEKVRIDSSGRVLIGKTTATDAGYGTNNNLQLEGTDAASSSIQIKRNSNDSNGPYLYLGKSRGTSVDSDTIVQNGDEVGSIIYHGTDGTDANNVCAKIVGAIDGAPGGNDLPGRLMFMTTADGAGDSTERLRITSAGAWGIAGANYGTSGQFLKSGGSGAAVSWGDAGGGIDDSSQWRLTSSATGNQVPLTSWELVDTYGGGGFGSAMSESSGIFTFPSTGWWRISFQLSGYSDNHSQNVIGQIEVTTDNSSYQHSAVAQQGIYDFNNSYPSHALCFTQALVDVTNTTNVKVRFSFGAGQGNESVKGSSSYSYTNAIFTRLGDT